MKTKKAPDPSQSARFIEAARELGCDESPDPFEAAVKKVARHKPVATKIGPSETVFESDATKRDLSRR